MKRLKMVLYGEPGVGKSVFACHAPKPFFITSDGNYEWLEDFGADPKACTQVSSWTEAKAAFAKSYDGYSTIVVDLLEDLFKYCEYEYCKRNRIDHVSDHGYGKGYDATRNEFFIEICKLLSMDKHIILIMHGLSTITKDRRGVEHVKHVPSTRLPDKLVDMIEGRVRYFIRCYLKAEEDENGKLVKKRYLSLIPKENEFGIVRGIDENETPHDIELDFDTFAHIIGLNLNEVEEVKTVKTAEPVKETKADQTEQKTEKRTYKKREKVETVNEEPAKEEAPEQLTIDDTLAQLKSKYASEEPAEDSESDTSITEAAPVEEAPKQVEETQKPAEMSKEDKLAAIRAKIAARKLGNA